MKLLNPLGLLWMALLPSIIILYFKNKPIQKKFIPSIKLWEDVIKEVEGTRVKRVPLKWLLMLQLCIGLLIILSIVHPVYIKPIQNNKITLALDTSITMKVVQEDQTHLQMAKEKIKAYIDTLPQNTLIHLVTLNGQGSILKENADSKAVLNYLDNIVCTNQALNLSNAWGTLSKLEGNAVIFTDKDLDIPIKTVKVGTFDNVGIKKVEYDPYDQTLIACIQNDSNIPKHVKVSLEDTEIKDLQEISIQPHKQGVVYFHPVSYGKLFIVKIKNNDMLKEDNRYKISLKEEDRKRILLVGSSPYLQKAIESMPNFSLEHKKALDLSDSYDLYILPENIDNQDLSKLDKVWYLPSDSKKIEGKIKDKVDLKIEDEFLEDIHPFTMQIENVPYLKNEGRVILRGGKYPLMTCTKKDNQVRIYSSINISQLDFVHMPQFPIWIENMLNKILKENKDTIPSSWVEGNMGDLKHKNLQSAPIPKDYMKICLIGGMMLILLEGWVYRRGV